MCNYCKLIIYLVFFVFSSACDISGSKKKHRGTHHDAFARENINTLDKGSIDNAVEQAEPVPDYLRNSSGFFISVKNNRYLSFEIAIKKITLVDFNGNIEDVAVFTEPKMIDLAQVHEKELVVFDQSVFASEYERLIIIFDVKKMQAKTLENEESIKTFNIENFLDLDLSSQDFVMEVGINRHSGAVLQSGVTTQFDMHFDLDVSLQMMVAENAEVAILRPSVKVNTVNELPESFLVRSSGFIINDGILALNTHANKDSGAFWLEGITLPQEAFIAIDGIRERLSPTAKEDISSQFIAHVKTDKNNAMMSDALFLFEKVSEVYSVLNVASEGSVFSWGDQSVIDNMNDNSVLQGNINIQNTVFLKPALQENIKNTVLVAGQSAQFINNRRSGGAKLIVSPVTLSASVADMTADGSEIRITLNNPERLSNELRDFTQTPLFALMGADDKLPSLGQRIQFNTYLSSQKPWSFIMDAFMVLKEDASTVVFSQSEFDHKPIISQFELIEDELLLTLEESIRPTIAHGDRIHGASIADKNQWRIEASASTLVLTTFNAAGGISKQYGSAKALFDDYNQLKANGMLAVSVKAQVNRTRNTITELEIVFNAVNGFYDFLAYTQKMPLRFLSSSDFDDFDSSFVNFELTSTNLSRLFVLWSKSIPYRDEGTEENLCDAEEYESIDLGNYCSYRRLTKASRQLIGEFVSQQLFAVPMNQNAVRDVYALLISDLPTADQNMLQYQIITDQGYYPQRYVKNPTIKKAEKVIKNIKKIYKVFGRLYPELTLKNLVEEVDRRRKKPSRLIKR